MLLFKDKINYKLPSANGFVAHIDAPAYAHMGDMEFVEVMVVVDPQNPGNGCLEFVPGSHKTQPLLVNRGRIDPTWEASHEFKQLTPELGTLIVPGLRVETTDWLTPV